MVLKSRNKYTGFEKQLFTVTKKKFLQYGFTFRNPALRGALFISKKENSAILADYLICDPNYPYDYSEYTKEQNALMHKYKRLFRFKVDNGSDLDEVCLMLERFLSRDFSEDSITFAGGDRELREIDPTLPEACFEQTFIDCFGRETLDRVRREFPVIDINGHTRWVDYYIRCQKYDIAIEKNGEKYHHPIITGSQKYKSQLIKQNSLAAYGAKVFRWSLEAMKFTDNFSEEMRLFFGRPENFLLSQKISVTRQFKLFKHQENALQGLENERKNGSVGSLVVLPTGTGKTEILIADFAKEFKKGNVDKALVMVPSRQLKSDHASKLRNRLKDYDLEKQVQVGENPDSDQIIIQTYSWLSRHYQNIPSTFFNYIAVDEAHHSMAPTVKKVIQHFRADSLIGFTATDQRLDQKKLETIFGTYETDLSLKQAIKQGLLAPIKAFRIKSNIDLSEVRFNGRDYMATDLQRKVLVPSRDELIVDVIKKYFVDSRVVNHRMPEKQGVIFCVSIKHAEKMARLMQDHDISAKAVSSNDSRSADYISAYQEGKIQFLTTCSLLNEGWDSPQTSVIVMARPTMSKVLYTQQLGRGTRKYDGKEALYVIDVVDNYGGLSGFTNQPWSIHAILGISEYLPWGSLMDGNRPSSSTEEVILAGLYEKERAIEHIDIFTFENKYPDHINDEQLARELFVSTGTVKSWVKKGRIIPKVTVPVGRQKINYFSPEQVDEIITDLKLQRHDETTQYKDFFEFIDKGDFTLSYKMVMLLSMLKVVNNNGECHLDDLLAEYTGFYKERVKGGLKVDRLTSPYAKTSFLNDPAAMKRNLLQNPFEKFERKRFMYHCKDLNHISFSNSLWNQINNQKDLNRLKTTYFRNLIEYFKLLDGLPDEAQLKVRWQIPEMEVEDKPTAEDPKSFRVLDFDEIKSAKFKTALPLVGDIAAGKPFSGFEIYDLQNADENLEWIEIPEKLCSNIRFLVRVSGDSMEPTIMKGDYLICEYHRHRQANYPIVIMGDFSTLNAGEVAIKRIFESEKHWIFKSDNPAYQDIVLEKEYDEQYPILGTIIYNLSRGKRCY